MSTLLDEYKIEVKRKEKLFDIRPYISRLEASSLEERCLTLEMHLRLSNDGSAKPTDILELLKDRGITITVIDIERTGLFVKQGSQWVEP